MFQNEAQLVGLFKVGENVIDTRFAAARVVRAG